MCETQREVNSSTGEPSVVFIDELAEGYSIPYSHLKLLPEHSYFHGRNPNRSFELFERVECSEKRAESEGFDWNRCSKRGTQIDKCIEDTSNLNKCTDMLDFQPYSDEIVAMPLTNLSQSVWMPWIANIRILDQQILDEMQPSVPYGGFPSNSMFHQALPVAYWPNYNPVIGTLGM